VSRAALPPAGRLFIVVVAVALAVLELAALPVFAADALPTPADIVLTGDPRSDGAGPGIVGSPLAILLGVIALGLATVAITLVLSRLSRRD